MTFLGLSFFYKMMVLSMKRTIPLKCVLQTNFLWFLCTELSCVSESVFLYNWDYKCIGVVMEFYYLSLYTRND